MKKGSRDCWAEENCGFKSGGQEELANAKDLPFCSRTSRGQCSSCGRSEGGGEGDDVRGAVGGAEGAVKAEGAAAVDLGEGDCPVTHAGIEKAFVLLGMLKSFPIPFPDTLSLHNERK